ncbi:hypothetical protein CLV51_106236 [Chitinophaga niastensis]|uniref:Uncharacterized protein n=1 Tax=Chitinophaga niastensis TaxID=536980 RepID=A0A2P8HDR0_CHINA|nr:hypothetical protein [Chitinophaga niastensis]PSL44370.1 hypothetical protein CLV51_106236 [Chitinophaga niastensis]
MRTLSIACFLLTICITTKTQAQQHNDYDINKFITTLKNANDYTTAGSWKEAAMAWGEIVTINPLQGEYWDNLGEACMHEHHYEYAIVAYEQSYRLGYDLPHMALYHIAGCYAQSGQPEKALDYLERAMKEGSYLREYAQHDTLFTSLQQQPRFKKVLDICPVNKLSRREGWLSDIRLFAKEYKRLSYAPFQKMPEKDFDEAIAVINDHINHLTDAEITIELAKILGKSADGHTRFFAFFNMMKIPPQPGFDQYLPLKFFLFKEGLYVIQADKKYEHLVGAQVLNFDHTSVSKVLEAVYPLIATDRQNSMWLKRMAPNYMRVAGLLKGLHVIDSIGEITLTIKDINGILQTVKVQSQPDDFLAFHHTPAGWTNVNAYLKDKTPLYLQHIEKPYWFQLIPENKTVYFQFNRVRQDTAEAFKDFITRLFKFIDDNDVDKLVIDLRWNGGGNTFMLKPLIQGLIKSKINQKGKLFGIIGRGTFSAAQNLTTQLERNTEITFAGEPSGSNPNFIGEDHPFTLPYSKLIVNFSTLYWQSSHPLDNRTWTAPDIYIEPTFADFITGQDRALQMVLKIK